MLAKSFNLASSIARLVMMNFSSKSGLENGRSKMDDGDGMDATKSKPMLLGERNLKIAFHILNKLTFSNQLFAIDAYVKQLVHFLVNKM